MSETKRDYQISYGKPPRCRPFQKGQSGNPSGPRRNDLSALLIAALIEPVYVTIDGKRRKIAAAPEPAKLTAPDREVVELFVARLRRQIAAEAAEAAAADVSEEPG
jgi:hypothetical protein